MDVFDPVSDEGSDQKLANRALLDAVPKFSVVKELKSIEGNVPNLVIPTPGCRFHPRCPYKMDVCRKSFPEMIEVKKRSSGGMLLG